MVARYVHERVAAGRDVPVVGITDGTDSPIVAAPGETLWVRATAKSVEIHREFERLVIHSRAARPGERVTLLAHLPPESLTPELVSETVCAIRRSKLPDPVTIGNAGSFFKNPVVASTVAAALQGEHAALPAWPAGEQR